jgi:hypothetical protein
MLRVRIAIDAIDLIGKAMNHRLDDVSPDKELGI